jgi:hypothetical protein
MPNIQIKTREDLIFLQYAKILVKIFSSESNEKITKETNYDFIEAKFHELKSGAVSWADIVWETPQPVNAPKRCAYCGTNDNLLLEYIVPRALNIKPECASCDTIQGVYNQIWTCSQCKSFKGNKGLYMFFKLKYKNEKDFYDFIPPLLENKYLKTIYNCHKCANTLNKVIENISVLNLDFIIY